MNQPKIEVDYEMMNFDTAVLKTRQEPGLPINKIAKVLKSRLSYEELECLVKELKLEIRKDFPN